MSGVCYLRAGITSCVCVTIAASLPSPRVIFVCHTIVVRPLCTAVHSARAVSPSGIVAKKKDAERGVVVDEDAAIAIEHAAARRDDGNGANAIAFRHDTVFIGVDDLEFPEAEK